MRRAAIISTHLKYCLLPISSWERYKRQPQSIMDDPTRNLLRNNVPEMLRLALREPVTVVKDGRQIACIVSLADFAEADGEVTLLGVETWNKQTRAMHEFGQGAADDRVQRFARLVLHAAHSRHFAPLLLNDHIVA